ncbi:MAG TPA: tRNA (adenosine(37)-N6)-dimethylallyltransferase MiaA [Clostridia bacterium]|jgi:tRNA dimethylallyltransferase|nr:MAG: tRNA dimethylallyltransferase [Firmicutes bacterium ADurb.Bin146]HOD92818.1 tRNA (adenosine(37)-N6)-dimethylallyltransferase MiaA [Clostridia bacterium]HQM38968.1 tRNA (adenosine(37)-N6)-dimethylallyltransferase MiaA [Clostridia bacterium]
MNNPIIITGPTASGKSAIALSLAKKINCEIVSADSMQIYKTMNIGTAKPSKHEMSIVKHHMIDLCDIGQDYSVAQYKDEALACITDIIKRKKTPIIVGGTGLYLDALLLNIEFPQGKISNRNFFEDYLNKHGKTQLYNLLLERDKQAALTTHPNNTKRVIRYLDILSEYEGNLEEYKKNALNNVSGLNFHIYILDMPRDMLYKRIEDRVDIMLKSGLVKEVSDIISYNDISSNALSAIGYKEVIKYLRGYCTYEEMITLLKKNTRNYAKRQITWFKKYKDAKFINPFEYSSIDEISKYILSDLVENPENTKYFS